MRLFLLIVFLTVFVSLSFGQIPSVSPVPAQTLENDEQPIKVNTYLVNIPVIASDRAGRYIAGLTKDNFTITQDGEKQPIEFFADEQAPMNVAILIDNSGSTRNFIGDIQDAAKEFVKVFRPEDQGLVANFDSAIKGYNQFTSDQKKLRKAINDTGGWSRGSSDMQDAIYQLVTKVFPTVKGRKAIIVLTDGMVGGYITNQKLLATLEESDVLVYPILFGNGIKFSYRQNIPEKVKLLNGETVTREEFIRRLEDAEKKQMLFMESLGTRTGGRLYNKDSGNFKKIFQDIANELKNQYLVGFYPQNVDDGKTHKFSIEVSPKDIIIRTKKSIRLKAPQ